VSLSGRLGEIELPELLHFLAVNNRTGRVTLSRRDAHGLVVVRQGRIVYAASASIRETFGSLLVCRGLVTPAALAGAFDRQHLLADGRKLGAILVEEGTISEAQLLEVLHHQTSLVVQELCRWQTGHFTFDVVPVPASGDIGVDVEELVVSGGVATDQILLEAMTRIDELGDGEEARHDTPHAIASSPLAPVLRGELTAGLLRRAAAVAPRGLLLVLRGEEAQGTGQVGFSEAEGVASRIRIPLSEPTVVSEAVDRGRTWQGAVPMTPPNERLLERLGGARPSAALVVPMLLREGVGLVYYGDNSPTGRELGRIDDLEWALLEAGLAMERDLLDARMAQFERVRGYRP
jgi:hypothetical protein